MLQTQSDYIYHYGALQRAGTGEYMLKKIFEFFRLDYQSMLDDYITSHNPTCEADVERLVKEFERKFSIY